MKEELFLEMADVLQKQMRETIRELKQAYNIRGEEYMKRHAEFFPYIHLQAENKLIELYGRKRTKQFQIQLEECDITVLRVKR